MSKISSLNKDSIDKIVNEKFKPISEKIDIMISNIRKDEKEQEFDYMHCGLNRNQVKKLWRFLREEDIVNAEQFNTFEQQEQFITEMCLLRREWYVTSKAWFRYRLKESFRKDKDFYGSYKEEAKRIIDDIERRSPNFFMP